MSECHEALSRCHWCVVCERVSLVEQTEGFYWTYGYEDCCMHRLVDDRPFTVAAWWPNLRSTYHPEYPEHAKSGVRYPMPEYRTQLARREPENPYLDKR